MLPLNEHFFLFETSPIRSDFRFIPSGSLRPDTPTETARDLSVCFGDLVVNGSDNEGAKPTNT